MRLRYQSKKNLFGHLQATKNLLQSYLRQYILCHKNEYWPNIEVICSATGEELCMTSEKTRRVETLLNLQNHDIEEADSRIILHVNHAIDEKFCNIFVMSCDIDVFVLLVHYYHEFSSNGLEVNIKTSCKVQNIGHKVAKSLEFFSKQIIK